MSYSAAEFNDTLQKLMVVNDASKIQSAHSAVSIRMSQLVASRILTQQGCVDADMVKHWMNHPLIPKKNYGCALKHQLRQLFDSPAAQATLASIKVNPDNALIAPVIRASLQLSNDTILTDNHARLTALAAALSHIRQPLSHSCFSIVICLSQLSSHLDEVIKDFKELIETGRLYRKVGKQLHDFSFIVAMSNKGLNTTFTLDSKGNVNSSHLSLWKIPGIVAACRAMNIENPRHSLKDFLPEIKKETSVRQILRFLAKKKGDLFRRGCFAFESTTTNPLLAVWSNAIAGMAEGKIAGMLKSELLRATMFALDVTFKGPTAQQLPLIEQLDKEILKTMIQQARYNYDPFLSGYSRRHSTHDDGFVLYEKQLDKELRIDHAEAFQAFLSKIILEAQFTLKTKSQEERDLLKNVAEHLSAYVHSDAFLDRLLPAFMQQKFPFEKPSENISKIKLTPWRSPGGNDTGQTLEVYFGESLTKYTIVAENAQKLLEQLVLFGREIRQTHPELLHPRALTTARIEELHAFNLTLGHATLKELLNSDTKPIQWIEKNLIAPGEEVAVWIPNKKQAKIICRKVRRKFLADDDNARHCFRKYTRQLIQQNKNLAALRESLQELLNEISPTATQPNRLAALDTIILKTLPKKLRAKITSSAVHIVDANLWCGEEDLHFCCIYNPCRKMVELWKCCHNNTSFTALVQDQWVTPRWELYTQNLIWTTSNKPRVLDQGLLLS